MHAQVHFRHEHYSTTRKSPTMKTSRGKVLYWISYILLTVVHEIANARHRANSLLESLQGDYWPTKCDDVTSTNARKGESEAQKKNSIAVFFSSFSSAGLDKSISGLTGSNVVYLWFNRGKKFELLTHSESLEGLLELNFTEKKSSMMSWIVKSLKIELFCIYNLALKN